MTTLVDIPTTGLEDIQRQAFYVLFDSLNDAIAEVEAVKQVSDEEFATHTGRLPFEPTSIERVAPENFHEGHIPTLISAPVEAYPNICTMAVRATPAAGTDQLDQVTAYRDLLYVEIMVKAIENEETVNRRIHRTADAVNVCMMRNRTLNGIIYGFDTAPTVNISDVFTRKERTAYGPHWYWQGARLEYAVRKEAVHPSSSPGSDFRAAVYDIDQA